MEISSMAIQHLISSSLSNENKAAEKTCLKNQILEIFPLKILSQDFLCLSLRCVKIIYYFLTMQRCWEDQHVWNVWVMTGTMSLEWAGNLGVLVIFKGFILNTHQIIFVEWRQHTRFTCPIKSTYLCTPYAEACSVPLALDTCLQSVLTGATKALFCS